MLKKLAFTSLPTLAGISLFVGLTSQPAGEIKQNKSKITNQKMRLYSEVNFKQEVFVDKFLRDNAKTVEVKRVEEERKAAEEEQRQVEVRAAQRAAAKKATKRPQKVAETPRKSQARKASRPIGGHLASIRNCESGGNYNAVSSSGKYRGAYQFSNSTWQSVGGSGDPAKASPEEQDKRAQILYDRSGPGQWPTCSKR